MKTTIKTGEYNGKPLLEFWEEGAESRRFAFGPAKARMILDHISEIKKFVEDNENLLSWKGRN